jgi:hypothetical protein
LQTACFGKITALGNTPRDINIRQLKLQTMSKEIATLDKNFTLKAYTAHTFTMKTKDKVMNFGKHPTAISV